MNQQQIGTEDIEWATCSDMKYIDNTPLASDLLDYELRILSWIFGMDVCYDWLLYIEILRFLENKGVDMLCGVDPVLHDNLAPYTSINLVPIGSDLNRNTACMIELPDKSIDTLDDIFNSDAHKIIKLDIYLLRDKPDVWRWLKNNATPMNAANF